MKIRNRMIKGLLAVTAMTVLMVQTTFAAEPEPYTFTVTLSAGNQGEFLNTDGIKTSGEISVETEQSSNKKTKIVISELKYGDSIVFENPQDYVKVADEKYYPMGIRESGLDNAESELTATISVEGDADYVVAYGIAGNMVQYTVNYQDADGNELAASRTYYGAVGDKPVVAYQYIEGYMPQAYNLTKTLSSNAADNVFTFEYAPIPEGTTIVQPGQTVVTTVTTPAAGTTAGTAGGAGAAAGGAAAGGAGDAGAAGGAAGGEAGTAEEAGGDETADIQEDEVPQDTIDLDDEEVPLADMEGDDAVRETSAMPIVLGVLSAIIALAAIAGAFVYYKKHAK